MTPTAFDPSPGQAQAHYSEVHVWCASLDDAAYPIEAYDKLLTDKERERAKRFVMKRDRNRYVFSKGMLKTLIKSYTGLGPDKLQYLSGPYGKPNLDAGLSKGRLSFNMAESAGYALFAFTQNREIGVDIERIRDIPEIERIVSLFFSEGEQAEFASLPPQEKKQAFFNGWTRKEAFIKALGVGLSMPLSKFGISLAAGNPVSLVYLDKDIASRGQWTILDVSPLPEFSAALAVEGSGFIIRSWNLCSGMLG
jgi:4'-phosphopantetheinyl transferase